MWNSDLGYDNFFFSNYAWYARVALLWWPNSTWDQNPSLKYSFKSSSIFPGGDRYSLDVLKHKNKSCWLFICKLYVTLCCPIWFSIGRGGGAGGVAVGPENCKATFHDFLDPIWRSKTFPYKLSPPLPPLIRCKKKFCVKFALTNRSSN